MESTVAKGLYRDPIDKARSVYGFQAFVFVRFSSFLCPRVKSASFPASNPRKEKGKEGLLGSRQI